MKTRTIITAIAILAALPFCHAQLSQVTNVNTGTFPNSGTGDPAYVAFNKVNTSIDGVSNAVAGLQGSVAPLASTITGTLGEVYSASSWANLNGIFTVSDGSWAPSISGGKIIFPPGDTSFGNYIQFTNMPNDDQNWSLQVDCTLLTNWTANSILFLGRTSFNPWWQQSIHGGVGPAGLFQMGESGGIDTTFTDSSFVAASNNEVIITFTQLRDKFGIQAYNVQSNYVSGFTYISYPSNGLSFFPNSGYPTIYNTGNGKLQINSIKIISHDMTNAPWAFVGDSVMLGNQAASLAYTIPAILEHRLGQSCDWFTGAGDRTVEITNDLPYILALHPQNVLLRIGENDVSSSIWNPANYEYIVNTLTSAGINVWNLCGENAGSTTVNPFLMTNYPTTTIPCADFNQSTMVSPDGLHPNALGYLTLANDVSRSLPKWFSGRYSPDEYHTLDNYQLAGAEQAATNLQNGQCIFQSGVPYFYGATTNSIYNLQLGSAGMYPIGPWTEYSIMAGHNCAPICTNVQASVLLGLTIFSSDIKSIYQDTIVGDGCFQNVTSDGGSSCGFGENVGTAATSLQWDCDAGQNTFSSASSLQENATYGIGEFQHGSGAFTQEAGCGAFCGQNMTSGSGDALLGDRAGINISAGLNDVMIDNQGQSADQDVTRIGTLGNQTNCFIAGTILDNMKIVATNGFIVPIATTNAYGLADTNGLGHIYYIYCSTNGNVGVPTLYVHGSGANRLLGNNDESFMVRLSVVVSFAALAIAIGHTRWHVRRYAKKHHQ